MFIVSSFLSTTKNNTNESSSIFNDFLINSSFKKLILDFNSSTLSGNNSTNSFNDFKYFSTPSTLAVISYFLRYNLNKSALELTVGNIESIKAKALLVF